MGEREKKEKKKKMVIENNIYILKFKNIQEKK